VAKLTDRNEIKIHRHLALHSQSHPGSERVLALLDHFKVQGVNGEHNVLVSQVVGPHLEAMSDEDPSVIQKTIKTLIHQVALGISFLHHCGVVHAGGSTTLSADWKTYGFDLDLHQGNIAFEISSLNGSSERKAMLTLGVPKCVPVITQCQSQHTDSLPKYLVDSGSLIGRVKQDDMHLKIIDLGEGSLRRSQLCAEH
jgi:serine/threonine-protein kinase SRPK3